ncbi:MAG: PBP1A family penicillin-binding protein [Clostridiales bacterium]|nr:PBP1A family penicillin-binding protein [Clostridiales bacterium]
MNYGKKSTRKQQKELVSKGTMIRKKFYVIFCKALLICFFAVIIVGGCSAFGVISGIIDSAPTIEDIDATPTGFLSTVLDCTGMETATLVASGSNRKYVTIDEIPEDLQHAFVAIEDERFYDHNGIDLKGIIRAGVKGLTTGHFSEGASTITQQLLKNTVFTGWTSESSMAEKFERKFQEQYLALQLEKVVNKDWILENYLNAINLGQNTLGVGVASERYFGKDVSELSLSECAVLAAITQSPTKYNPISHPEDNAERRKKVLTNMLDQEYITHDEYEEALADNVYDRIQLVNIETKSDNVNSYFVDELTDQIIADLVEQKGYTETQAYKTLYQGGLTIYSTQDPEIQQICDDEVNNLDNYPTSPKVSFSYRVSILSPDGTISNYSEQTMLSYYQATKSRDYNINFNSEEDAAAAIEQYKADIMKEGDTIVNGSETVTYTLQPQAALTVIDQSSGEVKALVGGRGDKTANKTLNRATDTTRQPGSTFKIIAAYAAALDAGGLTLADVQDDAPYTYGTGEGASVSNYDGRYRGFTTLREAITYSINIVTVKTLAQIGPSLGYDYIIDFGFSTIGLDESSNETLALGGLTHGVTNLELTAAYATIANNGTYIKPKFYTKVLDHDGNVLLDNTSPTSHTVLKETTAWLLTNAMEDVMTQGTGTPAYFGNTMAQAGKSGTTTKNRDALFAGYTPYYTCVVWGGYDDNSPQNGGQTTYPKKIWKSVMSKLHEDLPYKDFTQPSGIVTAQVCRESGKLAIAGVCDNDPRGSAVYTEYFAAGTQPTEYCDHHTLANICNDSGQLAGGSCPLTSLSQRVFVIGGTPGTEDNNYLLLDGITTTCTLHNGENATYQGAQFISPVPGVTTSPEPTPETDTAPTTDAGIPPEANGQ